MDNVFIQLAIILGISSILGFFAKYFKLPLLVAYLLGGLLIALTSIFDVKASEALSFLPEIGVAFVLFLVGMELDLREIRNLGKPILVAGIFQIIITTIAGFALAQSFGFESAESMYLGIGLSFSSTIVVIKLLLEKNDLSSLYGKLSLGILLLEDLLAVLLLLWLTASPSFLNTGLSVYFPFLAFILKAVLIFVTAFILNQYILSPIFKVVSESGELLFLTALAWCFIYVSFAILLGFSIVIGAFLAGVVLASSPYHFQIQGKVKPLRDFFVTLFFVYLGTQVNFNDMGRAFPLIILFTIYTLVAKPILFLLLLGSFGFRKHTMFNAAINMSQISEFSLIILLIGFQTNVVSSVALTIIATTGVLSILISSIMIANSHRIYKTISFIISFFERKNHHFFMEDSRDGELEDHVVVIGGHRVGGEIVRLLKKEKIPHIILDFNPHQVEALQKEEVHVVYGDMGDPEVLDNLNLDQARLVISTAPGFDDNQLLLEELKIRHVKAPIIVRGEGVFEAKKLYQAGADFVIIPEVLAGDFLADKLKEHLSDGEYFKGRSKIELERLSKKTFAWE